MDKKYGYQPETGRVVSPCLGLETNVGHVDLTWVNTRLRTFANHLYDHVEYNSNENGGQLLAFMVAPDVFQTLVDHDFPRQYDPFPDSATEKWLISMLATDLETAKPTDFI
jgi:hypothetical protein